MDKIIKNVSSVIDLTTFPPVEVFSNEVQTLVNTNPISERKTTIVPFYYNCSKKCCCSSYPKNINFIKCCCKKSVLKFVCLIYFNLKN